MVWLREQYVSHGPYACATATAVLCQNNCDRVDETSDERGRMDGRKTHATASASSSESILRMSRISSITSVACDENSEEEERRED